MNIDNAIALLEKLSELSIGGAKEGLTLPTGEYCIFRCRDAGVWAGILEEGAGRLARIADGRRLWLWKCKTGATLSEIAMYGISESGSKISAPIPSAILLDVAEILPTTAAAEDSIRAASCFKKEG